MKIVLASGSPRRKELMEQLDIRFEIIPAQGEELISKEVPEDIVGELSNQKAEEVAALLIKKGNESVKHNTFETAVIGADTIVVQDKAILGKPKDAEDAVQMIMSLQGQIHSVYTGVCVIVVSMDHEMKTVCSFVERTEVTVYPMSEAEVREYVATGEPMDKAGGYAIQGIFARYIKKIDGDYYNVMGLPIARLWQVFLKEQKG